VLGQPVAKLVLHPVAIRQVMLEGGRVVGQPASEREGAALVLHPGRLGDMPVDAIGLERAFGDRPQRQPVDQQPGMVALDQQLGQQAGALGGEGRDAEVVAGQRVAGPLRVGIGHQRRIEPVEHHGAAQQDAVDMALALEQLVQQADVAIERGVRAADGHRHARSVEPQPRGGFAGRCDQRQNAQGQRECLAR